VYSRSIPASAIWNWFYLASISWRMTSFLVLHHWSSWKSSGNATYVIESVLHPKLRLIRKSAPMISQLTTQRKIY
ncbi:hypothetical protein FRC02_003518, partial [Tulasnella sp. 418]